MDPKYKKYLKFNVQKRIKQLESSLYVNQDFLEAIAEEYKFALNLPEFGIYDKYRFYTPKGGHAKIKSIIKSLMREWSKMGASEREETYQPLIDAAKEYFPSPYHKDGTRVKVLVPGTLYFFIKNNFIRLRTWKNAF